MAEWRAGFKSIKIRIDRGALRDQRLKSVPLARLPCVPAKVASPNRPRALSLSAGTGLHAPFLILAIASRDHVDGIEAVVSIAAEAAIRGGILAV
jgi:hypothetical protein